MMKTLLNLFLLYYLCLNVESLHLKGDFNTSDFFKFLAKFGFQKTAKRVNNLGFIYGNITSQSYSTAKHRATFVVVDRQYFLDYYGNRIKSGSNRDEVCNAMFRKIDTIAFDRNCKLNGTEDFLRTVPCPNGELCEDEDTPLRVVDGHQFTYAVQDHNQARYSYGNTVFDVSLISFFLKVKLDAEAELI